MVDKTSLYCLVVLITSIVMFVCAGIVTGEYLSTEKGSDVPNYCNDCSKPMCSCLPQNQEKCISQLPNEVHGPANNGCQRPQLCSPDFAKIPPDTMQRPPAKREEIQPPCMNDQSKNRENIPSLPGDRTVWDQGEKYLKPATYS